MGKTALITGASSGIGYEFAKRFARNGYHPVIVSRNEARLAEISEELEDRYAVTATVVAKDLCRPAAPRELYDELEAAGIDLDVLVNNAGMGANGQFTDLPLEKHQDLIQLNISAVTALCHLFGNKMASKGAGRILNVASMAAFQPGPLMGTYYASKAYVLSLSQALDNELAPDGVRVTVLCPGPTETAFFETSEMADAKLARSPLRMKARDVARIGFDGLMKGKRVVVPGAVNKLLVFLVRFFPRSALMSVARYMNRNPALGKPLHTPGRSE